ncbi:MAG: glycosyltransferase, partial [Thermodesulfobacteriota bacterium]
MKSTQDKDIVFISVDPWQEDRWARKQMFAWLLSNKFRNVVYYVEPGRSERKLPHLKRIKNNLHLVDIPYIPQFLKHTSLSRLGVQISCLALWILLKMLRIRDPIFIIYQPQNLVFAKKLSSIFGKSLLCYDLTDDWSEFPGVSDWRKKQFVKSEKLVIKEVDTVFAVSKKLIERAKEINPNTFYLPNATSFNNFNRVTQKIEISREILAIPEPRVGYIGKITPWRIDFVLIRHLSETRPDWSIIMIGPIHPEAKPLVDELGKLKNVFFLGPRNYYSLPEYIKGFNVCILPHRVDTLTESMDPIKLYDYMATGKPVVTTSIPEALKFKNVIKVAESEEEFVSLLNEVIS